VRENDREKDGIINIWQTGNTMSILVRTSTTTLKIRGKKGSSCLRHLLVQNKFPITLFNLTQTEPLLVIYLFMG
jgi:hypothetical protein